MNKDSPIPKLSCIRSGGPELFRPTPGPLADMATTSVPEAELDDGSSRGGAIAVAGAAGIAVGVTTVTICSGIGIAEIAAPTMASISEALRGVGP